MGIRILPARRRRQPQATDSTGMWVVMPAMLLRLTTYPHTSDTRDTQCSTAGHELVRSTEHSTPHGLPAFVRLITRLAAVTAGASPTPTGASPSPAAGSTTPNAQNPLRSYSPSAGHGAYGMGTAYAFSTAAAMSSARVRPQTVLGTRTLSPSSMTPFVSPFR